MANVVLLTGRMVADPELKKTGGFSHTTFRLAVARSYKTKSGERPTDFFDVVCRNAIAEFVCRNCGKGSAIAVTGSLETRTYQAKDGSNRHVVEVVASNIEFAGALNKPAGAAGASTAPAANTAPAENAAEAVEDTDFGDLDFGDLDFG